VILSADGLVVSDVHVVGGASDIRVVLADLREFAADLILGDQESDLAVLQLREASDLPHLSLHAIDTLDAGDLVLSVGNAFGVG
jgi:S1-C subfamily serine protease